MKQFLLGKKNIGTLSDGVFHKEVLKSNHLMRVNDSFGIDSKTLNVLPANTIIEIHEQEEDRTYKTSKENYLDNGEYLHFKHPGRDHRTQLFLPRKFFVVVGPKKLEGDELAHHNYLSSQGLL